MRDILRAQLQPWLVAAASEPQSLENLQVSEVYASYTR
jgi:hypothetical protein